MLLQYSKDFRARKGKANFLAAEKAKKKSFVMESQYYTIDKFCVLHAMITYDIVFEILIDKKTVI